MIDQAPIPVLEVYYSPACAPCKLELPLLADLSKYPSVRLVVVILDQKERAFTDLGNASPVLRAHAVLSTEPDERKALRNAGNEDGILPYARVKQGPETVCRSWRGRLTRVVVNRLISSCFSK